jgi:hypothetical protein
MSHHPTSVRRLVTNRTLKPALTELLTFALVATLVGVLLTAGLIGTKPSADVPPGGFYTDGAGRTTLYLQRNAKWYGSWQPAAYNERYWILQPLPASLLVLACGLLFWSFSLKSEGAPFPAARTASRQPFTPSGDRSVSRSGTLSSLAGEG